MRTSMTEGRLSKLMLLNLESNTLRDMNLKLLSTLLLIRNCAKFYIIRINNTWIYSTIYDIILGTSSKFWPQGLRIVNTTLQSLITFGQIINIICIINIKTTNIQQKVGLFFSLRWVEYFSLLIFMNSIFIF